MLPRSKPGSCFNVQDGLVQAIRALYENSSGAGLLNSQLGEFFVCLSGLLTLTHPVQLVPKEDHEGNTP